MSVKYICELQIVLHELLEIFMNCYRIKVFSIFRHPNNAKFRLEEKAKRVLSIIQQLCPKEKGLIHVWDYVQKNRNSCSALILSEALGLGYQTLARYIRSVPCVERRVIPESLVDCDNWWSEINRREELKPANDFANSLLDEGMDYHLIGAWIHGSLGEINGITGYSDFDALILLDHKAFQNPKKLLEIQAYLSDLSVHLYLYDPLQHHGIFLITTIDLMGYPEVFFPLELFRHCSPCLTKHPYDELICIRNDFNERKRAFLSAVKTIRVLEKRRVLYSSYSMKAFIQTVILLPAFYLQLKTGLYHYKKFTFDLVKKDFSSDLWEIVDKGTSLRQNWKYKSHLSIKRRFQIGTRLNVKALSTFHRIESIMNRKEVKSILGENYMRRGVDLANAMMEKLISYNLLKDEDV